MGKVKESRGEGVRHRHHQRRHCDVWTGCSSAPGVVDIWGVDAGGVVPPPRVRQPPQPVMCETRKNKNNTGKKNLRQTVVYVCLWTPPRSLAVEFYTPCRARRFPSKKGGTAYRGGWTRLVWRAACTERSGDTRRTRRRVVLCGQAPRSHDTSSGAKREKCGGAGKGALLLD